jgi:hypothetical protein
LLVTDRQAHLSPPLGGLSAHAPLLLLFYYVKYLSNTSTSAGSPYYSLRAVDEIRTRNFNVGNVAL